MKAIAVALIGGAVWLSAAGAQPADLDGYFIALSGCEANRKKDTDNPGNIRLEPMRAYEMLARNDTPGTHYRVRVPGAPEIEARWVAMSCGAFAPQDALITAGNQPGAGGEPVAPDTPGGTAGLSPDGIEYVLAASWQPGFCATPNGRDKPECRSQSPDRADATRFSIHGLWPDDLDDTAIFPCYCDRGAPASCRGSQEAERSIDLSDAVLQELAVAMPGVQSSLHLHEWSKHGTCYEDDRTDADRGADPDEYFSETIALLEQLNASPVQDLFEAKLGDTVSRQEIEAAFDQAFGAGAGERVLVRCFRAGGENVITELWIGLKGAVTPSADLAALIRAAPTTEISTNTRSCNGGRVVKVGAE